MDKRALWLLPVLGLGIWYVYTNKGVHTLTLDEQSYAPAAYAPYADWWHQRTGATLRHYPDRVGPACLGSVLAAEDGAISTTREVTYAA